MTLTRGKKWLLGGGIVVALGAAAVLVKAIWRPMAPQVKITARLADIELGQPDALIRSAHLSALPRDLLRVPLLHDVLSEDFVSYYEINEARLSLAGTLRRIAYEHKLEFGDEVIRRVLDEPAEVALWRGDRGRLQYWALVSQRNGLSRLLQGIANVALDDSQLRKVGQIKVDGDDTTLYALAYGYQRNLLFAVHGERMVALSDPGMLLDDEGAVDGDRGDLVSRLLDGDNAVLAWAKSALAGGDGPKLEGIKGHQLLVSAKFLSFGYQPFFPGIEALRFDFADGEQPWSTRALIDPAKLPGQWNSSELWRVLPTDAAACASLPVDWASTRPVLAAVVGAEDADSLSSAFAGPAAACWYGKSRLSSPLFVAKLAKPELAESMQGQLQAVFSQVIGAYEAGSGTADGRLGLEVNQNASGGMQWQRDVSARYGSALAGESMHADQLSSGRFFPVTMALADGYVLFSPDGSLVKDALSVLAHSWPAMADDMDGDTRHVVARISPDALAKLAERESFAALPQSQEPVFRNAATQYLIPRLHALGDYPALSLRLPDPLPGKRGWVPVQWEQASSGAAR